METILTLSQRLEAGTILSTSLVAECLDRIAEINPKLRAFSQVFEKVARDQAAQLDAERTSGRTRGPLHGIPVAVKDLIHCHGSQTRAGSAAYSLGPAEPDAPVVAKLRDAGAIIIGKTNTVEFGYGGWGTNSVTGTPWNPRSQDEHYVPGGSSSGSAVAVAAQLVPFALGTDTGGSCRTPAAFCGCVGVKPSRGLISTSGVVPLSPSFDTVGVLAQSVNDAALALNCLTEASTVKFDAEINSGIDGVRIGYLAAEDLEGVHPAVRSSYKRAIDLLQRRGAHPEEFSLPNSLAESAENLVEIVSAEIFKKFGNLAIAQDSEVQAHIRARILNGRSSTPDSYAKAQRCRLAAQREFANQFQGLDALITPTCPAPAVRVSAMDETLPASEFTRLVNYLDMAAISVPADLDQSGLPTALQIVAMRDNDPMMMRIGQSFDQALGGAFYPANIKA